MVPQHHPRPTGHDETSMSEGRQMDAVDRRTVFAYHEAGHAIVSMSYGIQVRYVTLRPRKADTAGHVVFRRGQYGVRPRQIALLAGAAAEALYLRRQGVDLNIWKPVSTNPGADAGALLIAGACDDYKQVYELEAPKGSDLSVEPSFHIFDDWVTPQSWITDLEETAQDVVSTWWTGIAKVAEALLVTPRALTQTQIYQIIGMGGTR